MLTGKQVRIRFSKDFINPSYLDTEDAALVEMADRLLEIFRTSVNKSRGEMEEEIRSVFGDHPDQLIFQGLAKLLEDRCEFNVVSSYPPEEMRALVFQKAADLRKQSGERPETESGTTNLPAEFDRSLAIAQVAQEKDLTPEEIELSLYADLRSEQRLLSFKDLSAVRLLQRYNVALAQAVLLRATSVVVTIRGESPQRYRQVLRRLKFHRLLWEVKSVGEDSYELKLDGPLSLFSATQKYGLQLALFFPAILLCRDFQLNADLLWGAERKPKQFVVDSATGLTSHYADTGMYLPQEVSMFQELFRKKIDHWEISAETNLLPLGKHFWVPDFQLTHKDTGESVYLDILGFWRRSSLEQQLKLLQQNARVPFLLAISDQFHVGEETLENLPGGILRFKQMPLPQTVAKEADRLIKGPAKRKKSL